jgi:leucine-rich repeat protein SHOC2
MGSCFSGKVHVKSDKIKRAEKTMSLNMDNENLNSLDHLNDTPLPYLNVFSAHNNCLSSLPQEFFEKLTKIKKIDLSNNRYETIDIVIFHKESLERLNMSENLLSNIDMRINKLSFLKELNLSRNNIIHLDENIKFPSLQVLELSHNRIKIIPNSLILSAKLEFIDLSHNEIISLPEENWENTNITTINLEENNINNLPRNFLLNSKISVLNLKNNKITKSQILRDEGYEAFENRRKLKKDQGYMRNLDIDFNFCGLDC